MSETNAQSKHPRPDQYYNTIHVEDFYDKIHRSTWARRGAAVMAGTTMGAGYGSLVGLVAAFLPHMLMTLGVLGATGIAFPALAAVGATVALFAGAGAFIGIAINTDVSANASSVAAGLEEMEKRHKRERLQDGLSVEDGIPQNKPVTAFEPAPSHGAPKLFSAKVAAITVPLFAAFGALIALNPFTAALVMTPFLAHLPLAAGAAAAAITGHAAMAISAAIFGMFGGVFAMKNSFISNKLNNFYFGILSEQIFEKHKAPEVVPAPKPEMRVSVAVAADQRNPEQEGPSAEDQRKSYAETVGRRGAIQEALLRAENPTLSVPQR